ncbi:hypothetical protein Hanom_Chr05g00471851 [Helianthus anomalus]
MRYIDQPSINITTIHTSVWIFIVLSLQKEFYKTVFFPRDQICHLDHHLHQTVHEPVHFSLVSLLYRLFFFSFLNSTCDAFYYTHEVPPASILQIYPSQLQAGLFQPILTRYTLL